MLSIDACFGLDSVDTIQIKVSTLSIDIFRYSIYADSPSFQKRRFEMKVSLSLIAISLVVSPMLLAPSEFADSFNNASELRAAQKEANHREAEAIQRATRELSTSEVALSRVQAACVSVVDVNTQKVSRLTEGEPVSIADGAGRTLDDGTLICNQLGDTAEVWQGVVRHIARVAPTDKDKYEQFFSQQFEEQSNGAK